jgi:hypothetical protein
MTEGAHQTFIHEVTTVLPHWRKRKVLDSHEHEIVPGDKPVIVFERFNLTNTEVIQVGPEGLSSTRVHSDGTVVESRPRNEVSGFFREGWHFRRQTVRPA